MRVKSGSNASRSGVFVVGFYEVCFVLIFVCVTSKRFVRVFLVNLKKMLQIKPQLTCVLLELLVECSRSDYIYQFDKAFLFKDSSAILPCFSYCIGPFGIDRTNIRLHCVNLV